MNSRTTSTLIAMNLLALVLLATAPSTRAAIISNAFDASLESWTADGSQLTFFHVATGGNPGGYVSLQPASDVAVLNAVAPSAYHGNLSAFNGGTIGFDGVISNAFGSDFRANYGLITISDGSTTLTQDIAAGVPVSGRTSYSGSFSAAGFGTNPATWNTLIANVTDIRVRLNAYETAIGSRSFGFDNFFISSSVIPEPGTVTLLLCGLGFLARRFHRR